MVATKRILLNFNSLIRNRNWKRIKIYNFFSVLLWIKPRSTVDVSGVILSRDSELVISQTAKVRANGSITLEKRSSLRLGDEATLICKGQIEIPQDARIYVSKSELGIGKNVIFGKGVDIFARENTENSRCLIGDGSRINDDCMLDTTGNILIGDDSCLSARCVIYSHDHDYKNNEVLWKGGVVRGTVKIGSNVWVGYGCVILNNVEIADRVIIAAGSVVTKNCLYPGIYAGVPAKLVKEF